MVNKLQLQQFINEYDEKINNNNTFNDNRYYNLIRQINKNNNLFYSRINNILNDKLNIINKNNKLKYGLYHQIYTNCIDSIQHHYNEIEKIKFKLNSETELNVSRYYKYEILHKENAIQINALYDHIDHIIITYKQHILLIIIIYFVITLMLEFSVEYNY
jgi:hypothetical protein